MADYLAEMRHALDGVFSLIWDEHREEDRLYRLLHRLDGTAQVEYRRAEALAVDAQDPDDVAFATVAHWETYWGSDRDRHSTAADLDAIRERLRAHRFSVHALSEAVLQYAKQGISLVHSVPNNDISAVPNGRQIGSQPLKNVIWQGRNQAQHWETGSFSNSVIECFAALEADSDRPFGQYTSRNMAFDVLQELGWRKVADFERDMRSLG